MHNWITPYMKKYKGRITLSIIFASLGVMSGAMLLFVSGFLISKSSLRPENIMIVYVPIVSVRAFSIMQAVFPYVEKLVSHDIVLRILSNYRKRLYNILEPQALFLQSRFQTGDILSVLSDDIEKLQDFYIRTFIPSITGIAIYTIFAITLGFFDVVFMFVMLAVLGVIVFLMPLISYYMMKRQHLAKKEKREHLYQQMTDAAFGQLDWIVSGRVHEVEQAIQQENARLMKKEINIYRWHHLRDAFLRFVVGAVIVLMMYWTNAQVDEATITPTLIAAFVLMMFSITDALLPISDAVEEIPTYIDSFERMEKLGPETAEKGALRKDSSLDLIHPTIKLEHVTYRYGQANNPVLSDLSWTIMPGEKIAVLGKSGTGKSTLLKLISGVLKPETGSITMNGMNMDQAYIGKLVSVLNQKAHLFHTTIANNLRIGKSDATEEEMIAALEQAQIMELIATLPDGIHTQMDEMGQRFSGGERQRIAFARVLLQQTPIILMDEPTTGLDPLTERDLLETMLTAAKSKTIIWVTHHLAGAEMMDEVIFLDKGNITLQGPHAMLMDQSPYYRSLYEMDERM